MAATPPSASTADVGASNEQAVAVPGEATAVGAKTQAEPAAEGPAGRDLDALGAAAFATTRAALSRVLADRDADGASSRFRAAIQPAALRTGSHARVLPDVLTSRVHDAIATAPTMPRGRRRVGPVEAIGASTAQDAAATWGGATADHPSEGSQDPRRRLWASSTRALSASGELDVLAVSTLNSALRGPLGSEAAL